jgi:tRNA U34 2-thiouridine synthase MnmA/TrmU
VIVFKTPTLMRVVNMLSILKITQGNTYTVKSIETGKRRVFEDFFQTLLVGRLLNPVIYCNKALIDANLKQAIIPLAIRLDMVT